MTGCELVLDERALADLRQLRRGAQGGIHNLRAIARGHERVLDTAASRRLHLCSRSPSRWVRVCALTGQQESSEVGRRWVPKW